jgi:CDK-activating kinase assembly factor MAT1
VLDPKEEFEARRERDRRRDLNSVFCASIEDFPSRDAYNDHLEFVEDVVWALTRGSAQEKEEAELRVQKYKTEHHAAIQARTLRAASARTAARRGAEGGVLGDATATSSTPAAATDFSNLPALQANAPALPHPRDPSAALRLLARPRETPRAPSHPIALRMARAGGQLRADERRRAIQDALAGLVLAPRKRALSEFYPAS